MSDEEKKAIEQFKNFVFTYQDVIEDEYSDYQEVSEKIINLIEKQSKEIEELKNKNKTLKNLQNDTNRLYIEMTEIKNYLERELEKNDKKWENKIKAMLENEIINISGFECVAKEDVQSLLEKE